MKGLGALRFALFSADDLKIRALMAAASFAWSFDLLFQPEVLDRPYYILMKGTGIPAWAWATGYLAHAVGAVITITKNRLHGRFAAWVNGWGCFIWFAATLAQNISQGYFLISTSLELLCTFELFLVWIRTQQRP